MEPTRDPRWRHAAPEEDQAVSATTLTTQRAGALRGATKKGGNGTLRIVLSQVPTSSAPHCTCFSIYGMRVQMVAAVILFGAPKVGQRIPGKRRKVLWATRRTLGRQAQGTSSSRTPRTQKGSSLQACGLRSSAISPSKKIQCVCQRQRNRQPGPQIIPPASRNVEREGTMTQFTAVPTTESPA